MSKIIELKNVNKWFDKFQALKDINLEVNQQEKIVICGPSGSGKSTLIRCINRLEEHQDGQIIVDGKEISENTKDLEKIFPIDYENGCDDFWSKFQYRTVAKNAIFSLIQILKYEKSMPFSSPHLSTID